MVIADILLQDFIWEVVRFLFMLVIVVCGIYIGVKLRKRSDAKKSNESASAPTEEIDSKDSEN